MGDNYLRDRLDPHGDSPEIIEAIWETYRQNRTDLEDAILTLLRHGSPMVREEALNLLAVRWRRSELSHIAGVMLGSDPDFGVRSAAAWAIAVLSAIETRAADIQLLRSLVLNTSEDTYVRQAAYQALKRIAGDAVPHLDDDATLENIDFEWVQALS